MKNEDTILTLSQSGIKMSVELPWDASIEDLIQAFYSTLIGITFNPQTIVKGFKEFLEENGYVVIEEKEYTKNVAEKQLNTCNATESEDLDSKYPYAPTSESTDPFIQQIIKKVENR